MFLLIYKEITKKIKHRAKLERIEGTMNFEEKIEPRYSYNYYQHKENDFCFCTPIIGKLPKIRMTLPKISIIENMELSFC